MKKMLLKIIFALSLCLILPCTAFALDLQIKGISCVLMDGATGEVLYAQNADAAWYPASVTKLMTMTLALEAVNEGRFALTDIVTTSPEAAAMGGSQVYLYAGEQRTLQEMLIAVAVGSGNDAAYAVAEFIGGTYDNFIAMMNEKAKALDMNNTNFLNPHGLYDANHYTSAGDLAKLAFNALYVPGLVDYTSIYEYQFRPDPKPLILWNTNRLLKWYNGTIGLKTGFTKESGYNLVSCAERNGLRLICVVMGVSERNGHFSESMKLLNYGFNNYEFTGIYEAGSKICTVNVDRGKCDTVDLCINKRAGVLQKKGEQAEIVARIIVNKNITAPIEVGEIMGKLILVKNDVELTNYDLVAATEVEKAGFTTIFKRILKKISFAA